MTNQQSQWQPIETAPRDGAEILAYQGFDHWYPECGPRMGVVVWRPEYLSPREGSWSVVPEGSEAAYMEPTHWMPLPPPPVEPGA